MGLIPPIKPYFGRLSKGFACMIIYVACWPILAFQAGKLIPAIGSGDLNSVSNIILRTLIIFNTDPKSPDPIAGISFPARNAKIGQQATYIIMQVKPLLNLPK